MWEHRNDVLHQPDHPWKIGERSERVELIQDIYSALATRHLNDHRWILQKSLPQVLQMDDQTQQQWLDSARMIYQELPEVPILTRQMTIREWTINPT